MQTIESFAGEFAFLSNFTISPIKWDNRDWLTVEHLFQAAKTLDSQEQEKIRLVGTPGKAKRLGKKVRMRRDWEQAKRGVMLRCIHLKFDQNPDLRELLIKTGDAVLIEGNHWHDNIWGNCFCDKCKTITGQNLLGQALMTVRRKYV